MFLLTFFFFFFFRYIALLRNSILLNLFDRKCSLIGKGPSRRFLCWWANGSLLKVCLLSTQPAPLRFWCRCCFLSVESVVEELPNWTNASLFCHEDSWWHGRHQWYFLLFYQNKEEEEEEEEDVKSAYLNIAATLERSYARGAANEGNPCENSSSLGIDQQGQYEVGLWSVYGQLLRGTVCFLIDLEHSPTYSSRLSQLM